MRRRAPSALYSVLDEEDLLGGVDLTDYPDPAPDAGAGRAWSGDRDDDAAAWSPDVVADEGAEWSPDDVAEGGEWSPEAEGFEVEPAVGGESAWSAVGPRGGSGRGAGRAGGRRLRALGAGLAVVAILLVTRLAGGLIDTRGPRLTTGEGVGALSAVSPAGAASAAARQPPVAARPSPRPASPLAATQPRRPAGTVDHPQSPPAGSRLAPRSSVGRGRSPSAGWRGGQPAGSHLGGAQSGPAGAGGAPGSAGNRLVDSPKPARASGRPASGGRRRSWETASPEQEFGFER